jgi:hypothetical protein
MRLTLLQQQQLQHEPAPCMTRCAVPQCTLPVVLFVSASSSFLFVRLHTLLGMRHTTRQPMAHAHLHDTCYATGHGNRILLRLPSSLDSALRFDFFFSFLFFSLFIFFIFLLLFALSLSLSVFAVSYCPCHHGDHLSFVALQSWPQCQTTHSLVMIPIVMHNYNPSRFSLGSQ